MDNNETNLDQSFENNESENSTELLRANQMQGTGAYSDSKNENNTELLRTNQMKETDNFDSASKREEEKEKRKGKIYTIISSLILMIPFSCYIRFYTLSEGSFDESGKGAIWWGFMFIVPFLLLCIVASIIFAIFALKKKSLEKIYKIIALINIAIAGSPIVTIALGALINRIIDLLM